MELLNILLMQPNLNGRQSSSPIGTILMMILIIGIIAFFVLRNKNKNKENNLVHKGAPPQKKMTISIMILIAGIIIVICCLSLIEARLPDFHIERENIQMIAALGYILIVVGVINIVINKARITKLKESKTESFDQIDKLEKLAKLKDQGIITEEEFNEQKKKILNS